MSNIENKIQQAINLLNQGKMDEARPLLEEYIKTNPNETEAWRLAAQVDLNYYHDVDKAYDELIEALRLQPKNQWALLLMGNLLLNYRKDSKTASEYFSKILEYYPDNTVALIIRNITDKL